MMQSVTHIIYNVIKYRSHCISFSGVHVVILNPGELGLHRN